MPNDFLSLLQQMGMVDGTAPYEPGDALSKPHVEDLVKQQSLPGKSALQSAETLAPKELPVPASNVYNKAQQSALSKAAQAAKGSVAEGVIELGKDEFKQLPYLESNLPAVVNKGETLPALVKGAGHKTTLIKNLAKIGKVGTKLLGGVGLATELMNETANPEDFEGVPVPGQPGRIAKGDIIIPAPPQGPSIFEMASDAYGRHAEEMMQEPPKDATRTMAASGPAEPISQPAKPQPDAIKSLLDKLYGDDSDLKNAQDNANRNRLIAGLTNAGMTIGHGISKSGKKLDTSFAETLEKEANAPVQDVLVKRKAQQEAIDTKLKASDLMNKEQLRDPNSAVSAAYKAFALQAAPDLAKMPDFQNINAEGVKALLPGIDMMFKSKFLDMAKKEKAEQKERETTISRFDKMSKLLTAELAGSRTAFGRAAANYAGAERLQELVKGRNLNDIDIREVAEIAAGLDSMLSTGASTVSGREHLIPKTMRKDAAKIEEYLTNLRQGAQLGSFLNNMMHTVEREKAKTLEQIQRGQRRLLSSYSDLKAKDPEKWELVMREQGLPDIMFDESQTKEKTKDGYPRQVRKDGHVATVKDEAEYKDAQSKGWN